MESPLLLSSRASGVLTLTLNRPHVRNALNGELLHELVTALSDAAQDDSVGAVVLTGTGNVFSSGGDRNDMRSNLNTDVISARSRSTVRELICLIAEFPAPLLAAVNGPAVGAGWSILLGADAVYAGESAIFAQGFLSNGLSAGAGSTWWLPRLIGPGRAKAINVLGASLTAAEAKALGLVTAIFPDSALHDDVSAIARQVASSPREAVRQTKALLTPTDIDSLKAQLDAEARALAVCLQSDEHAQALVAG